jgi:hypothetical protein
MPIIFPTIGLELQKKVDEKLLDYESKKENNNEEEEEKGAEKQ